MGCSLDTQYITKIRLSCTLFPRISFPFPWPCSLTVFMIHPSLLATPEQLGTTRNNSAQFRISRSNSEQLGATRNNSEQLGIIRNKSELFGITRNCLEQLGITRHKPGNAVLNRPHICILTTDHGGEQIRNKTLKHIKRKT